MSLLHNLQAGPPFNQATWWLDDKGLEHLIEPLCTSTEKWFLRQLGQVKIDISPSLIEITWDTGLAEVEALETVKLILSDLVEDVTVRLNFFYYGWAHEVYNDLLATIERIEEIQDCRSVAVLHEVRSTDRPISDVHYANSRIKNGFRSWQCAEGKFDKIDQIELARMLPYALVFRSDNKEENIVYSWVGRDSVAARVYGLEWTNESIGKITNRSFGAESQKFADKVSIGICETLLTGKPQYQHFRSLMRVEGQEPFWAPYERLLTRHVLRCGTPIVVSDVFPTQYVDIPLAGSP